MKKDYAILTDTEKKEVSLFDVEEKKRLKRKAQLKEAQVKFKKLGVSVAVEFYQEIEAEASAKEMKVTDYLRWILDHRQNIDIDKVWENMLVKTIKEGNVKYNTLKDELEVGVKKLIETHRDELEKLTDENHRLKSLGFFQRIWGFK